MKMTSVNVEAAKTEEVRTLIPTTRVLKILAIISALLFVVITTALIAYVLVFYLPHKCTDSEACRRSEYTACGCGQRKSRSDRIVGGSSTYDGEWPFIVSLRLNGQHSCAATLISCRWIVSAAHCFRKGHPENWIAVFGVKSLDQGTNQIQIRKIKTITLHPLVLTASNYDVALLELSEPVEYTDFVQPACLPAATTSISGQTCTTIGWGQTSENVGSFSNELLKTEVKVYNNTQCREAMPRICAGIPDGGRDACKGDSGGPLLCQDMDSRAWIVAGVVSAGVGCGRPDHPGLYTETAAVHKWIQHVIL